jgi:16S rRNA (cytidine1402-2'-O)-methyltransferase
MEPPEPFPPGTLAVVAMPLGNPDDITLRALQVLECADVVAAEDTRSVGRMLSRRGISARLLSYHDWNEAERAEALLGRLARGERVALVSEAGTPGISDPGYDVVRRAREEGLPVFPVPGPSALAAFISVSGLPTDAFSFFGFPPNRPARRRSLFQSLVDRTETLVFYESPRRIVSALRDALETFGDRECALAREMTKPHEEFLFGPTSRVLTALDSRPKVRGEVCWGLRGANRKTARQQISLEEALREGLDPDLPPREAAREVARRCGVTVKEAYAAILAHRARSEP